MQLVAYGAQDIYLTGNPQITFFKVVYRRHTNFSMEAIEQTISGTPGDGGNSTVTISRNGDLVYKVYVTNTAAATNGSKIVSEVELEIGGQKIDKHYEEWNQIWNELSTPESKAIGLKSMIGDIGTAGSPDSTGPLMTQYPLNFWFCRNPGLALPLIALQYHEVKLKFTWGTGAAQGVDSNIKVLCDYIYLDTDERRRFAQVSHEYLIEQIQKETFNSTDSKKLNFNHPVKELIWTSQASSGYRKAQLKLNGHDRFSAQESEYFQLRQPFDYHTAVPKQNLPTSAQLTTLDRQTQFETIGEASDVDSLSAAFTEVATGDATSATNFDFTGSNLILEIASLTGPVTRGDGATAVVAGDQLAIVATTASSSTTNFTAGLTFFATVTATPTVAANVATIPITSPTTADESPLVLGATADVDGVIRVFAVTNGNSAQARTSQLTKKINVYSFGLKPEEHQPSGTCNFSRIDNAQLNFSGGGTAPTDNENIYAVNYNVLRIMSGMGGLAYSN